MKTLFRDKTKWFILTRREGVEKDSIATNTQLLGRDPETLRKKYSELIKYGVTNEK
ncbi:MAG: hypothetical protein ACP5M9_02920 [Candidatus Micrarchaeia archaeon]